MLVLAIFLTASPLHADMGPKSSLEVEILGFDEPYVYDVLIKKSPGTIEPVDQDLFNILNHEHYLGDDYPDTLNGFQDEDGFASGILYSGPPMIIRNTDDHIFSISYFNAPKVFKVVLFNEEGSMIISEAVERDQFNASFEYDLSGISFDDAEDQNGHSIVTVPSERLSENYRGPTSSAGVNIGLETLFRLTVTLIIELGVLFLFFYRRRHTYLVAGITNVITQGVLTAITVSVFYYWGGPLGALVVFVLGEAVVFLIEMVAYPVLFKEKSRWRAVLYAFVANTLSLVAGFALFILL